MEWYPGVSLSILSWERHSVMRDDVFMDRCTVEYGMCSKRHPIQYARTCCIMRKPCSRLCIECLWVSVQIWLMVYAERYEVVSDCVCAVCGAVLGYVCNENGLQWCMVWIMEGGMFCPQCSVLMEESNVVAGELREASSAIQSEIHI